MGTYPTTPKLTQKNGKNNNRQYFIPDNYIIETELAKKIIKCETRYISSSKVNYTISWKEGRADWSINNTRSSTAAVNTFLKVV